MSSDCVLTTIGFDADNFKVGMYYAAENEVFSTEMEAHRHQRDLLQKQHPADLAQIFGTLLDTERSAVFALLVERQPKLAMETISEMGPEPGAHLLTGRSADDIAKLHAFLKPGAGVTTAEITPVSDTPVA